MGNGMGNGIGNGMGSGVGHGVGHGKGNGRGLERIMQYVWEWRLYGEADRRLTDGSPLRIVHPGLPNRGSGPDFFNARVDIDGVEWAGCVELHVRASDWHRHGHDGDVAYDAVVLHVVGESDSFVCRTDGSRVPQLLLPFGEETAERFRALCEGCRPLRCASWIGGVPRLHLADWLQRAGMERLEAKGERLARCVEYTNGDWSQALFIVLARALGFGLNGEPFERLARALPLSVAARHGDSVFQLEALLLGHAGLLAQNMPGYGDEYYGALRDEYAFLAYKYGLSPLPAGVWRLSGVRPANMPYRKLALLARLLQGVTTLFSRIMDAEGDPARLLELFDVDFGGSYWERHLTFGVETGRSYRTALSGEMARVLLVNVAAPLYHAYGRYTGDFLMEERGWKLLRALPAERNSVMKMWAEVAGVQPADAFESQALLHVKREYCERSECLRCRVGHKLIRQTCPGAARVREGR